MKELTAKYDKNISLLDFDKETKKLILELVEGMKNTDFSILSKVSNEHIEEEKIKLLKQVIENLNE